MNLLRIYLIALPMASLLACTDHRVPETAPGSTAARMRVKTIEQPMPDGTAKVSAFAYDSQGRLQQITAYQTPDSTVAAYERITYQYDGQNQLVQVRRGAVLYPRGSQPNRNEQYNYAYNASKQVSSLAYAGGYTLGLNYNASGVLESARRYYSTGGLIIDGADSFTFTGANLSTYNLRYTIAGHGGPAGPASSVTTAYTYDTNTNPFFSVAVIPAPYPSGFISLASSPGSVVTYFGGVDNVLNLSQNNVLTETSLFSTTTYQYQYNAAGLPTRRTRTTTPTNGVPTVQTLTITYETY